MTLIIIEGVNGTGKSTYADKLSFEYGSTTLRAFRRDPNQHFDGESKIEMNLRRAGIPFNTHVEDFYIADTLATIDLGNDIRTVLDRSLPSALAYGQWPKMPSATVPGRTFMFELWKTMLEPIQRCIYVWLEASAGECAERIHDRPPSTRVFPAYETLVETYDWAYRSWSGRKLRIDTEKDSVEQGVELILKTLNA